MKNIPSYLKLVYSKNSKLDKDEQKEKERRFILSSKLHGIGFAAHRSDPKRFNWMRSSIHLIKG